MDPFPLRPHGAAMSGGNHLRDETGALIGGLVVLDYKQGKDDFEAGNQPPEMTSPSYDLGRQRAAERAAEHAEVKNWMDAQGRERMEIMRGLLSPEEYEALVHKIADIWAKARSKPSPTPPGGKE